MPERKRIGLTAVELVKLFPSPESKEYPTPGVIHPTFKYTATKPGIIRAR